MFDHPAADPQHKLTFGEFGRDLLGNFGGLVSRHNLKPLLMGGAATGLATIPEQNLEAFFAPGDRWGRWAALGQHTPLVLVGSTGLFYVISRKSDSSRFRSFSYAMVHGMIIDSVIVRSTKAITRRERPNTEDKKSFPSGHSSQTFMWATVAGQHYGWKVAIPGYLLASYVAATRLENNKHHLTDVVAGAAIGIVVGSTVSRRMRNNGPQRVSWRVVPTRGGIAASISIRLLK